MIKCTSAFIKICLVLLCIFFVYSGSTLAQIVSNVASKDKSGKKSSAGLPKDFRFIYNCDADNMFGHTEPPMTPEKLYHYVDLIAGTRATTLFMSPNAGMPMNFPTKVGDMVGEYLDPELERLIKPDSKEGMEVVIANIRSLVKAGHDPLALILARARKNKMEAFVSFRMNETHETELKNSFLFDRFWRDHPEWHIGKAGDSLEKIYKEIIDTRTHPVVSQRIPAAMDFAVPEVRAFRLAQLKEICENYDIDGLELDFQRFPMYFKSGQEAAHIETMTTMMREIREMTNSVGKKRNRKILLSCRIMALPSQNKAIGLDPFTWAREKLVDFYTISHFLHNNFTLPIAEYRSMLPAGIPLYASLEYEKTIDKYIPLGKALWKLDINGIYLFNLFATSNIEIVPPYDSIYQVGFPKYNVDQP